MHQLPSKLNIHKYSLTIVNLKKRREIKWKKRLMKNIFRKNLKFTLLINKKQDN